MSINKNKYLKYKKKYLDLKNSQSGGAQIDVSYSGVFEKYKTTGSSNYNYKFIETIGNENSSIKLVFDGIWAIVSRDGDIVEFIYGKKNSGIFILLKWNIINNWEKKETKEVCNGIMEYDDKDIDDINNINGIDDNENIKLMIIEFKQKYPENNEKVYEEIIKYIKSGDEKISINIFNYFWNNNVFITFRQTYGLKIFYELIIECELQDLLKEKINNFYDYYKNKFDIMLNKFIFIKEFYSNEYENVELNVILKAIENKIVFQCEFILYLTNQGIIEKEISVNLVYKILLFFNELIKNKKNYNNVSRSFINYVDNINKGIIEILTNIIKILYNKNFIEEIYNKNQTLVNNFKIDTLDIIKFVDLIKNMDILNIIDIKKEYPYLSIKILDNFKNIKSQIEIDISTILDNFLQNLNNLTKLGNIIIKNINNKNQNKNTLKNQFDSFVNIIKHLLTKNMQNILNDNNLKTLEDIKKNGIVLLDNIDNYRKKKTDKKIIINSIRSLNKLIDDFKIKIEAEIKNYKENEIKKAKSSISNTQQSPNSSSSNTRPSTNSSSSNTQPSTNSSSSNTQPSTNSLSTPLITSSNTVQSLPESITDDTINKIIIEINEKKYLDDFDVFDNVKNAFRLFSLLCDIFNKYKPTNEELNNIKKKQETINLCLDVKKILNTTKLLSYDNFDEYYDNTFKNTEYGTDAERKKLRNDISKFYDSIVSIFIDIDIALN